MSVSSALSMIGFAEAEAGAKAGVEAVAQAEARAETSRAEAGAGAQADVEADADADAETGAEVEADADADADANADAEAEAETGAGAGAGDASDNREAGTPAPPSKRPSETTAGANHPAAEVVAAVKDAEDKASSHALVTTSTTTSMEKVNDGILAKKKRVYLFTHAWGGMDVLFHVFVVSPVIVIIFAVVAGE